MAAQNEQRDPIAVEMLKTEFDEGARSLGRVTWNEIDGVQYSSDMPGSVRDMLEDEGVYVDGRFFTPKDGRSFVEMLPTAFSGSALRARKVEA